MEKTEHVQLPILMLRYDCISTAVLYKMMCQQHNIIKISEQKNSHL